MMNYSKMKRLLDIVLSLFGLTIISPILVIVAISIKIESRGPIIFQQERLGLNGKIFKMYKFRTMYVGAEKSGVYESLNDARVTKVGRLLRKTSLDEIPQFINIIKGDMSIIGPRPTLTYHPWQLDEYTVQQKKRFSVKPGITGWAQINGRKELPWIKRIEYDVAYVEKLSFRVDVKIFFKTIIKVLMMKDNVNVSETAKEATSMKQGSEKTEAVTLEESRNN